MAAIMEAATTRRDSDSLKSQAIAELKTRGCDVSPERVTIGMSTFRGLSDTDKAGYCRFGGRIVDESASAPDTNQSTPRLTFPTQPPKTNRTAADFMKLSAGEVEMVTKLAADSERGALIRQELFDVRDPLREGSAVNRMDLHRKFDAAYQSVRRYGPSTASWDDPAPPTAPNAMDAGQFLALSRDARNGIDRQARMQRHGRVVRAELKRAYRNGSPAEQEALFGTFGYSLQQFPLETV